MKRILFIDDEEGIHVAWANYHELVEKVFQGTLTTATSLTEAKAKMAAQHFDAIVLDIHMPPEGRDGVIQFIRENSKLPSCPPIIAFTGDESIETRQECLSAGAAQFFTKWDAEKFPNLFFKCIYNEYWKRNHGTAAA